MTKSLLRSRFVIPASSTDLQNQREECTYLSSPEGTVGVITQKTTANATGGPTTSTDTAYWHKDHLGSLVAITNPSGQVTQRFRFDAWGNRDCLSAAGVVISCSSSNTGGANNTGSEERGFTGHEMLDEVGLIHMNGRLFDPAIARFTQADPIIQEPLNSQNYNRYSYVLNNPLVYTDPSGYSFWTKVRQPLATVAIMVVAAMIAGPAAAAAADEAAAVAEGAYGAAAGSSAYSGAYAATQAAYAVGGGFAAGGISGGNIESAVMGAVQAGLSFGIGEATATFSGSGGTHSAAFGTPAYAFNVLAHAALGCGMSAGAGGTCKSGALAGAFSAAAGPVISGLSGDSFAGGLAGRMAAGCVGSYIGKGSCEAGAVTAAFDYLYNACGSGRACWEQAQLEFGYAVTVFAQKALSVYEWFVPGLECVTQGCSAGGLVLAAIEGSPQGKLLKGVRAVAEPIYKTTKEARIAAEALGFKRINETVHEGEAVFKNGKRYITRDVDGHNGGAWKMADSVGGLGNKQTRIGTFDSKLNRIGD